MSAASVGQVHPVRAPGRFLNEQSGADSEPGKVLETAKQPGIDVEHPTDRADRAGTRRGGAYRLPGSI